MAEQQHPITPLPSVIDQLRRSVYEGQMCWPEALAAAYRAGADAELEAILKIPEEPDLSEEDTYFDGLTVASIRENRRPKPPSLAELALEALKRQAVRSVPSLVATQDCDTICTALKRLQQLEQESNG